MKKSTRRIIFYAALVLFAGLSYVAILYAQGYKYSFAEKRFLRTGAITLHVNTDAKVFIDDEVIGSTSFLTRNFSVDRLLPGQYRLRLEREGYSSWQKQADVREGMVTDFSRVLLLPLSEEEGPQIQTEVEERLNSPDVILSPSRSREAVLLDFHIKNNTLTRFRDNGSEEIIAKNVVGFTVSENRTKIAWWTQQNELWVMWLKSTVYQPAHAQDDRELITRLSGSISRTAWFRGEDHLVVSANSYRVIEIDKRGGVNIIRL